MSSLKLTSIVRMTEERIKAFTMEDLKKVFESINETEAKIMVDAIKESRFDKASHVIEMAVYREMQKEVTICTTTKKD